MRKETSTRCLPIVHPPTVYALMLFQTHGAGTILGQLVFSEKQQPRRNQKHKAFTGVKAYGG